MTRTRRRIAVPLAMVLLAAGWLALDPPTPSREDGEAWTERFLAAALSPELLGASGPAAAAAVADFVPLRPSGACSFYFHTRFPQIIDTAKLSLHRNRGDACTAELPFNELLLWIRPSAGVTVANFVAQFTARFGAPKADHRRGVLDDPTYHTSYHWYPWPGLMLTIIADDHIGWRGTFFVTVSHEAGKPTAVPPAAEAQPWMDGLLATITGPLLQADATTAPALLGGLRANEADRETKCVTSWSIDDRAAEPAVAPPYLVEALLSVYAARDGHCEHGVFGSLWLQIWPTGPVQAQAFVERLTSQYGAPEMSRDDAQKDHDAIDYVWRPDADTQVRVTEPLHQPFHKSFDLQISRSRRAAGD